MACCRAVTTDLAASLRPRVQLIALRDYRSVLFAAVIAARQQRASVTFQGGTSRRRR